MSENNNIKDIENNNQENFIHCCGICRKCKNICEDYQKETIWDIVKHKIVSVYYNIVMWFNNSVLDPLSVWYDVKFNKVYRCHSCGMYLIPKFENNDKIKYISFRQCGWWKIKNSDYPNRWCMCHYCVEHRNSCTHEEDINEWNKYVSGRNTFLINKIKKEDMDFYVKYIRDKSW